MDAGRETEDRESVATIASLALLTQVVLVYATNALHKVGSDVWFDGEALEYVLKLDQFSVLIGPVIAEFDVLVTALDWFWLVLLFSSWLLLATTGRARGILAVLFIAMHIGMALTLDLGVFPLVSITSLLPFLPAPLWDRVDDLTLPQAIPGIARLDSSAGQTESVFPIGDSSHGRRLRVGIHGVLLALLLVSNAVSIGLIQAPEGTPEELTDSSWTMFAPPPTGESWVVAEGRLANNRTVDVLHGGPVNTDRPPDVDRFPNARWEKHLDRYSRSSELRPALADYLCRRWNDGSETTLENIQFRRVWAPIEPGAPGDTLIVELGHYRCGGEAENEVKSLARVPVDGYS